MKEGWISVKESMPEMSEDLFSKDLQIKAGKHLYKNSYYDGMLLKWFRRAEYDTNKEVENVTHWKLK